MDENDKQQVPTVTVWPSNAVSVNRFGFDAVTVSREATPEAATELAAFLRGCLADAYLAGRQDGED